jgi:hypothetical protein
MTSIKRAGHSNLLIGGIAALAIVALAVAVLLGSYTIARLADDEQCLRSVVAASSERSAVLTSLAKRRTNADNLRQFWNTQEQRAFAAALRARTPADHAKVRHDFSVALHHYLRADAAYRRANVRYNQAAQAHPVPRLRCTDAGQLDRPSPTVTKTTTAPAPSPRTVIRTTHVPAPVTRTARLPGPTVTRPGPTRTATRTVTVTVPPGHHHGKGHR